MSLECTLSEFLERVEEFKKAAPTATLEALDGGVACVNLSFLNINPLPLGDDQVQAVEALQEAHQYFLLQELKLT